MIPLKKIAIVFRMDQPGGVQSCVLSLTCGLNRQGIVPDILWDLPPNWDMLKDAGVQAGYQPVKMRIPSRLIDRLPYTLRYAAWIFNLLDDKDLRQEYDFVYSFYNGLILNRTPHVYFLSGPPLLPQFQEIQPGVLHLPRRFIQWIYRKFLYRISPVYEYHGNSHYFINAQYTAGLFQEAHGVALPVLYPPINLANRSFSDDDLPNRDTITFFSRIVDYKRPEMFLELARRYPQFRALVMGAVSKNRLSYYQNLQKNAIRMGLKNIHFLANPSDQKVQEELARTRFYIFPAVNEHFGMTTPEVIASGAIPFVHNSGGQIEIVNDPDLRFDDVNYYEKFNNLLQATDQELNTIRHKLSAHVRKFSEENFICEMLLKMETSL